MTGDSNREIWERVGQLDGRVYAMEQSQERIERQLAEISRNLRGLKERLDRGAGFWSAVAVIASLIGSISGGAVWAMAQANVGPFDAAEEQIEEQAKE